MDCQAGSCGRARFPTLLGGAGLLSSFTSPFPHGAPLVSFKVTWKFAAELIFNNRSNVAHRCYSQIPSTESTVGAPFGVEVIGGALLTEN